jgi:hypothetical protein
MGLDSVFDEDMHTGWDATSVQCCPVGQSLSLRQARHVPSTQKGEWEGHSASFWHCAPPTTQRVWMMQNRAKSTVKK